MLRGADPKSKQDGSAHRGQQNKSSTVIYLARIRLRLHLNEMATLRARLAMVSDSRDAENGQTLSQTQFQAGPGPLFYETEGTKKLFSQRIVDTQPFPLVKPQKWLLDSPATSRP